MYLIGILQAFGIVLGDTLYNLYIKFIGINFDIKAFTFPLYYLIGNALTMMVLAGPGRFATDTLKNIGTWVYGVAYLLSFVVEIYLIKYVSSTELSILLRLTVPVCIILSLVFNNRKPTRYDMITVTTILIAMSVIFALQDPAYLINIALLCLTLAILEAMGYFIPENHSTNEKAIKESGIRGQMRVISFATFVTSMMVFAALLVICAIDKYFGLFNALGFETSLVSFADFFHLPTVLTGVVFGCCIAPFIRFFQWSASYKITSEGVLTILAVIPLVTFVLEWILVRTGISPTSHFFESNNSLILLGLSIFMAAGSWWGAYLKSRKHLKDINGSNIISKIKNAVKIKDKVISIGHSVNSMQDYEVVKITVDFYEQDFDKASETLAVPAETLKTLYYGKSSYTLKADYSQHIHKVFINKIFYLDQLTKLENRKGFEAYFNELRSEKLDFSLYYMDLNGFKQINDTYGHNVGDEVLISVAERMMLFISDKKAKAYRFGGDEFAIIIADQTDEAKIKAELREMIEQPITVEETDLIDTLTPRISIGKSSIFKEEDVKIKDVLQQADEEMYDEKVASKAARA